MADVVVAKDEPKDDCLLTYIDHRTPSDDPYFSPKDQIFPASAQPDPEIEPKDHGPAHRIVCAQKFKNLKIDVEVNLLKELIDAINNVQKLAASLPEDGIEKALLTLQGIIQNLMRDVHRDLIYKWQFKFTLSAPAGSTHELNVKHLVSSISELDGPVSGKGQIHSRLTIDVELDGDRRALHSHDDNDSPFPATPYTDEKADKIALGPGNYTVDTTLTLRLTTTGFKDEFQDAIDALINTISGALGKLKTAAADAAKWVQNFLFGQKQPIAPDVQQKLEDAQKKATDAQIIAQTKADLAKQLGDILAKFGVWTGHLEVNKSLFILSCAGKGDVTPPKEVPVTPKHDTPPPNPELPAGGVPDKIAPSTDHPLTGPHGG